MVRNIKIKTFLIVSFVAILVLMNVVGIMSLVFNRKLADSTVTFFEEPHTVQLDVAEVQLDMSQIGAQIREAIFYQTPEKTQKTTDFIGVTLAEIGEHVTEIKKLFKGDKSLIDATDAATLNWSASIDALRILMEKQSYAEAIVLFNDVYIPSEKILADSIQTISDSAATRSLGFYHSAQNSKVYSTIAIVVIDGIAIVLTIFLCSMVIKSITVPLTRIKNAADAMSRGDLNQKIDFTGKNEFGMLADSMRTTALTLNHYVQDIDSTLEKISDKDLTTTVNIEYIGDFSPIKDSLTKISGSLNKTLTQIRGCSEQVASGAAQVSSSTQVSSQGASEQASSIEELSTSISEISHHVSDNAVYTAQANQMANEVGSQLNNGSHQMSEMLVAISDINNASDQIAKIIKTIEDIAFQTNILALNAAIEAARAGEAGKGFAVVADEVRSLAGKSAEAAKSTTELIQNSILAVNNGTKIAKDTAATLEEVVGGASKITEMISNIASSSALQSTSLIQINGALDQITQTIQTNSAATQECAASSEEMSGQAQVLDHLVAEFHLKG